MSRTWSECIIERRSAKGYTLRDVERLTGIGNPLISQYETGYVKRISVCNFFILCRLYDLNPMSFEKEFINARMA